MSATVRLHKVRVGLYRTADGIEIEHRPDIDGWWYVTEPGCRAPDDVYPRLKDAREAIRQAKQERSDAWGRGETTS